MSASAWSVALLGLDGRLVEIEAAIGGGLPRTVVVGLPDASLSEAKERCKAAVTSSGLAWPAQLVTFNLIPATLPKSGSHYDLGMIAALLSVSGQVPKELLASSLLMGEVGLDGRVREVRGILPGLLAAARAGFERAIVPASQVGEANLVEGLTIWGVATLGELAEVLRGGCVPQEAPPEKAASEPTTLDLADVVGQPEGRWALEVAAAGRHHLLFTGPPGVGKTMLAARLPSLLPELSASEAIEVSAVHSLAGRDLNGGLVTRPPYADPHHSASLVSLVGGGARFIRPGAISLAHRGVLFLDEAPEFGFRALDSLRTPLESGWVTISRAHAEARYPACFQLVLAANPCPCGNAGTPGAECRCAPMAVRRYGERISGPILDRVDIRQRLNPIRRSLLAMSKTSVEPTAVVAERVAEARQRQRHRLADSGWLTNGEVSGGYLRRRLPAPEGAELLDDAVRRGRLSARGVDKVLRVAWTLADLAGRDRIGREQLHLALAMRFGQGQVAA